LRRLKPGTVLLRDYQGELTATDAASLLTLNSIRDAFFNLPRSRNCLGIQNFVEDLRNL
jgi:hypothetical protein